MDLTGETLHISMGILEFLHLQKRSTTQNLPLRYKGPDDALLHHSTEWIIGQGGETGITIKEETALETTAGYRCIEFIGKTFASISRSGKTFRRTEDDSRECLEDHPTTKLIRNPCEELYTASTYWQTVMTQLCTYGNHYSFINSNKCLIALDPKSVEFKFDRDRNPFFEINRQRFEPSQIFHVPGLVLSGFTGVSPVLKNRRTFELSLAAEIFGATFFGNGSHTNGYWTTPGELSDDAIEHLREQKLHSKGLGHSHSEPFYEQGIEWKQKAFSPEASQMLETRKYQDRKICQIYGLTPGMIGLENSAKTSEQDSIDFEKYTLRPLIDRIEQEVVRKLLSEVEKKQGFYFRFNVDSLLRADITTRYSAHNSALQNGWLNRNEIRALEDLKAIEGGDKYIMPLNFGTLEDEPKPEDDPQDSTEPPEEQPADEGNPNTLQKVRGLESNLEDARRYILTKEVKTLRNCIKRNFKDANNPDGFKSFIKKFYTKHELVVRSTLEPIFNGDGLNKAAEHCLESKKDLALALLEDEPKTALEDTLTKWMKDRVCTT